MCPPKKSMFYSRPIGYTASLVRDLSLEMPADEKARSGLMLAGGIISRKLRGILCKAAASTSRKKERSLACVRCKFAGVM